MLTRIGDICFMGGNVKFNSSGQNNYTKAQEKLPEGYRPVIVNTPVAVFGGETTLICYGEANGTVTMLGNPNSAYRGNAPAYGGPPTRCPPHSFGTLAQAVALSCSDPTGHSAYETVMPNAFVPCVPP